MAPATWTSYKKSVSKFVEFRSQFGLTSTWPIPVRDIMLFISYLSVKGGAPSTIVSHISALAFVHKLNGWYDPNDCFVIQKLKEGCRRHNTSPDSRLPITVSILDNLIQKLPVICNSSYEVTLFKASYLLAFFGFLRVGEITSANRKIMSNRSLAVEDVSFAGDCRKYLDVTIRFSKTDQRGQTTKLRIESNPTSSHLCPVKAMSDFLVIRPKCEGQLFVHFGGDPLTSYQFSAMLKRGISLMGLCPQHFSSHSFRIGAATSAVLNGIPSDCIKNMGRWKSSAYQRYIRTESLLKPALFFNTD